MLRNIFCSILTAVLVMVLALQVTAEDMDYLGVAAIMVRDGDYAKARSTLKKVDVSNENLDRQRYHMLLGLVSLSQGQYVEAEIEFNKVLSAGDNASAMAYLYLAQSQYGQQKFSKALTSLSSAGSEVFERPKVFVLKATSEWKLKQWDKALVTLQQASEKFPDRREEFVRQKILFFVEGGLIQAAKQVYYQELLFKTQDPKDILVVASAFKAANEWNEAILALEAARLRFADEEKVAIELAGAYIKQNQLLSAAQVFEALAQNNPQFYLEAAELYRKAGKLQHAFYLNAHVADQKKKMRQRLALFIDAKDFEAVKVLGPALPRIGLDKDEDIRYALAYTHFMSEDFVTSEKYLQGISRSDLYEKVLVLRKNIVECQSDKWACDI